MITALLAIAFGLEWNSTYRTDVPYEVEVSPAKLGANAFKVFADGKELKTTVLEGVMPGTVDLRFRVPAGTKALTCEGSKGEGALATNAEKVDNVFLGALDAGSAAKWKCTNGVTVKPAKDGFVFATDGAQSGAASFEVDIPAEMAGMPVMQEIGLENLTPLVWGGKSYVAQLDAKGAVLPETVADIRWTSHMRPSGKAFVCRNEGHIHLKARKLRFVVQIDNVESDYDSYGHKITDPEMKRGKLALTRLSVRAAERLPFPKWNDSFFGEGVSGEEGDCSFRFGGKARRAMFFQALTRAGWSQSHEFTENADRAFPAGAGTVEAWFRPDWKAVGKAKVTLFDAFHGYSAATHERPKGSMLLLEYEPATKTFSIALQDYLKHSFKGEAKGVEFKDGKWTHIALQWEPGKTAELYLDGKKVATVEIAGFKEVPLKDRKLLKKLRSLNDAWAVEFFVGASCKVQRLSDTGAGVYFEGEGDALRVSHVARYRGDFTPEKRPQVDDKTSVYFSYDRVFDGVMGGGFGFVPASVRADEDRVEHVLQFKGQQSNNSNNPNNQTILQYYPKDILPENDPRVVFDKLNYRVLPDEAEFRKARKLCSKKAELKPGERMVVKAAEKAYPEYVEFRNLSKTEPLMYPIMVADGRVDPRSFGDMSDSLGGKELTDRERVNRMFQFMLSASDYFASHSLHFRPGSDDPLKVCYEAMVVVNSYCGFECGPLNNMTANMMTTVAGCPAGQTGGYGHSFEQVFYDGKNHIYDLSAQKFFPAFDNETAAYLKEMGDQPGLKQRGFAYPDHFIRKGTRGCSVNVPSYQEKFAMTVNPGETLRVRYSNCGEANNLQFKLKEGLYGGDLADWVKEYAQHCGAKTDKAWTYRKDRIFTHRSSAIVTFDGVPTKENPAFKAEDGSFTYAVKSCYPIVYGAYSAELKGEGAKAKLEISTDGGKTFRPMPANADGGVTSEYLVKARLEYLIRVKAPMGSVARFQARTECEVNPRTYPGWVMKGGETGFTYKSDTPAKAEVTMVWREDAGEIVVDGVASWGTVPGCERSIALIDPAKPTTLAVKGVSSAAKVRTYGSVSASIADGVLKAEYDAKKPRVFPRGADDPEPRKEFPQFAAVDIIEGEAVKTVAFVISPNARLAFPEEREFKTAKKKVKIEELPAGRYSVFALGRFAGGEVKGVKGFQFAGPFANKKQKPEYVCRWRNQAEEFLKSQYGMDGERGRWKWDMSNDWHGKPERPNSGADYMVFDLAKTDHLDFCLPRKNTTGEAVEMGAVIVVPDPDIDFMLDAKKLLFGINTDPFHL